MKRVQAATDIDCKGHAASEGFILNKNRHENSSEKFLAMIVRDKLSPRQRLASHGLL